MRTTKNKDGWYGTDYRMIWHGSWSDPELTDGRVRCNINLVEDALCADFREEGGEFDDDNDAFGEFVFEHQDLIDEYFWNVTYYYVNKIKDYLLSLDKESLVVMGLIAEGKIDDDDLESYFGWDIYSDREDWPQLYQKRLTERDSMYREKIDRLSEFIFNMTQNCHDETLERMYWYDDKLKKICA